MLDRNRFFNVLNKVMNWGLSQTQIEDYANPMENGILKKYITHPQYPETLDIPNGRQFYLEIGEDLGFTKEESEEFVRAIDEYSPELQKRLKMMDKKFINLTNFCESQNIPTTNNFL